jgi:hypothetical protein
MNSCDWKRKIWIATQKRGLEFLFRLKSTLLVVVKKIGHCACGIIESCHAAHEDLRATIQAEGVARLYVFVPRPRPNLDTLAAAHDRIYKALFDEKHHMTSIAKEAENVTIFLCWLSHWRERTTDMGLEPRLSDVAHG